MRLVCSGQALSKHEDDFFSNLLEINFPRSSSGSNRRCILGGKGKLLDFAFDQEEKKGRISFLRPCVSKAWFWTFP